MATYLLDGSKQGYDPRLSPFEDYETETGIQAVTYMELKPVSVKSGSAPLEFFILNDSPDYIDLYNTRLHLEYGFKRDNDVAITSVDTVGPVQCPGSSFFNQCDLEIQQKNVNVSTGSNYAYKSIIDVMLGTGFEADSSSLVTSGYARDQADFDDAWGEKNLGLESRALPTKLGKTAKWITPIYADLCRQKQLIVNGVTIKFKFYPANDLFRLMWPKAGSVVGLRAESTKVANTSTFFTVDLRDATLVVPFVRPNPAIIIQNNERFKTGPAKYVFDRSDIKTFTIPNGACSWNTENLYNGLIPKRLVVCMVSASAYSGNNEKNGFNFQHFGLKEMRLQVDGHDVRPPIKCDFANINGFNEAYMTIFDSIPPWQVALPSISLEQHKKGNCFFVYDLQPSKIKGVLNPLKKGNTRLSITFGPDGLTEIVTLIAYATFDSVMYIDEARNTVLQHG